MMHWIQQTTLVAGPLAIMLCVLPIYFEFQALETEMASLLTREYEHIGQTRPVELGEGRQLKILEGYLSPEEYQKVSQEYDGILWSRVTSILLLGVPLAIAIAFTKLILLHFEEFGFKKRWNGSKWNYRYDPLGDSSV